MDSTFRHKLIKKTPSGQDRYICTIKVADHTSFIDDKGQIETCTVVLFAKTPEDLPVCQKVGDIIRVHRSNLGFFNGAKQFNLNMFYNSSWALYDGREGGSTTPFSFSGSNLTIEPREAGTVKALQKWAKSAFADNVLVSSAQRTLLKEVVRVGSQQADGRYKDFDLHVKIIQIFKLDAYTSELRITDESNEIWFAQVLNNKFRNLY